MKRVLFLLALLAASPAQAESLLLYNQITPGHGESASITLPELKNYLVECITNKDDTYGEVFVIQGYTDAAGVKQEMTLKQFKASGVGPSGIVVQPVWPYTYLRLLVKALSGSEPTVSCRVVG